MRLETLLSEAGNGSSETGAIEALGKEVARLREALAKPEAVEDPAGWRSGEAGRDPASREEAQRLRATIRALRKETTRLNKEVARRNQQIVQQDKRLEEGEQRSESLRETGKKLSRESLGLYRERRILRDCEARVRSLSDEAYRLRHALEVSEAGKDKLKARLAQGREGGKDRPGGVGSPPCQASHGPEDAVGIAVRHGRRAAQGPAQIAAPEGHDQVPVP